MTKANSQNISQEEVEKYNQYYQYMGYDGYMSDFDEYDENFQQQPQYHGGNKDGSSVYQGKRNNYF